MSHKSDLIENDIYAYLKQHEQKTLLRFITCGSVDDGKSTLIGRLLHDTQLIYEDQLAAIKQDSKKHNGGMNEVDFSLLVDGLQSEREQGITIDVAYRYFSTADRKYIIADTPGHEQYTRNMATGASTAQLAIILVDAQKGVQTQTRRHSYICSLLGIKHFVIAVNKMDLIGYKKEVFDSIEKDYQKFLTQLGEDFKAEVQFIPLSALEGDNVVNLSEEMSWYKGPALMEYLDRVQIVESADLTNLRFPVQYVNRPNHDFRGYSGTVASGLLKKGDLIKVLPSGLESRVSKIVIWEGELEVAQPGESVTLTLDDELDVSRGSMITTQNAKIKVGEVLDAHFVWMNDKALEVNKPYDFKIGNKVVTGRIVNIHYQTDINTLERHQTSDIPLNGLGLCRVELTESVIIDSYSKFPRTGCFIVIDRMTNLTVGVGMVVDKVNEGLYEFKDNKSHSDVVWNHTTITPALRAAQKKQKPRCIWLTGLSGSGKSTIANALEQELFKRAYHTILLDGDNVRHGLCSDLSMTEEDRAENIRRVAEVAKLMTDAGLIVITAFISPFEADRKFARSLFDEGRFIEVYVDTPLEECENRDTKGLYKKARSGSVLNFTGISSPFEAPKSPELVLQTMDITVNEAVAEILAKLNET